MPYAVSQVMGSDPESLLTASVNARASAQQVDAQIDHARTQFAHLAEDWTGTAATAAQKQGRESLDEHVAYRDHLYAVPIWSSRPMSGMRFRSNPSLRLGLTLVLVLRNRCRRIRLAYKEHRAVAGLSGRRRSVDHGDRSHARHR